MQHPRVASRRHALRTTRCGHGSARWALGWVVSACLSLGCGIELPDDKLPQLGAAGKAGAPAADGGEPVTSESSELPAGGAGGQAGASGAAAGSGGASGMADMGLAGMGGRPSGRRGGAGRTAAGSGGMGSGGRAGGGGMLAAAGAAAKGGSAAGSAANGCVQNLSCQLSAPPSTGDAHQDCVDRINQFRTECACLPPLGRWTDGEACADQMAEYDSGGTMAHAGFAAGICKGGSAQNECPGWASETQVVSGCLQQMWNEGPPPSSDCTGSCFQKYGHFINMTNTKLKKVACGFYKTEQGKLWSVQNFSQ